MLLLSPGLRKDGSDMEYHLNISQPQQANAGSIIIVPVAGIIRIFLGNRLISYYSVILR